MAENITSYSLENDERFKARLKYAASISADLRVPFGLISRDFYKSEQAIFKLKGPGKYPAFKGSEGDDGKTPYQRRKIKKFGFDYPLLVATGKLANSVLGPSNPGSVNIISATSLIIGTMISYAGYHQSDLPRSKMPLRKFLFIGPEGAKWATSEQSGRAQRWNGILSDHIEKELKKVFPNSGGA